MSLSVCWSEWRFIWGKGHSTLDPPINANVELIGVEMQWLLHLEN